MIIPLDSLFNKLTTPVFAGLFSVEQAGDHPCHVAEILQLSWGHTEGAVPATVSVSHSALLGRGTLTQRVTALPAGPSQLLQHAVVAHTLGQLHV